MSEEIRRFLSRGVAGPRSDLSFEAVLQRSRIYNRRLLAVRAIAILIGLGTVAGGAQWVGTFDSARKTLQPADSVTWTPVADGPLKGRYGALSVWTGDRFLIWGGQEKAPGWNNTRDALDGALYDPNGNEWQLMAPAPLETSLRTGVWTGQELLLWGGAVGTSHGKPDDGAAYDPLTNTWTALPDAPLWSLAGHSAIWTGREMIVWGGEGMDASGAAFDPLADTWRKLAPAPVAGRHRHAAIWTGSEMLIWGGSGPEGGDREDGAAYDPNTDTWRLLPPAPLDALDAPAGVWTGSEFIIWGGLSQEPGARHLDPSKPSRDGAAYEPIEGTWRVIPRAPKAAWGIPRPSPALWTGREMVVAASDGALLGFDPATDRWQILDTPMPVPIFSSVVNGGARVLVWGGIGNRKLSDRGWLGSGL